MARMNWNRARKKIGDVGGWQPRRELDLAHRATMILSGDHARHEKQAERIAPAKSGVYYRAAGSVIQRGGKWLAVDPFGEIVNEFDTRADAWRVADEFGYEEAGGLG